MAPRERSAISLLLMLSLISCDPANQKKLTWYRLEDIRLENNNGLVFYHDKLFSGIVFSFYPGTKDTAEVIGFSKGKEHGEWRRFFPGGKWSGQRFFDNGTKVKTLKEWWENGHMKVSGSFLQGENNGEYREWNKNGMLIRDMHYRLGYEEGSQKQFYDNGTIRSNYIVKNGKRFGLLGTKNCVNVTERIFQK